MAVKAPANLGAAGKSLWADIASKYELRPDELRVLASACVAADMESEFIKAWHDLGRPFISKGSMGQEVEHPLIGSIDKLGKSVAAHLGRLKLPDESGAAESNQQRSAAQSRWAAAHGARA